MKKNPSFLAPTDKVNATQKKALKLGDYEERVRHPNEALPRTIGFMEHRRSFDPSIDLVPLRGIARV